MKQSTRKVSVVCILLGIISVSAAVIIQRLSSAQTETESIRNIIICTAVLIGAMVLFATEVIPAAITSVLVPVVLSFPGIDILSGKDAFKNFGEQWTITFLAMYIIGYAIMKTGFADKIGEFIIRWSKAGKKSTMILLCVLLGISSAFLSNAACMALFAPIIIAISFSVNSKPSKFLMPVSFAVILGGNMTVMGASSKGIINGIMETYSIEPFSFFDYLPVGGIMFIAGLIYLSLLPDKAIPEREAKKVETVSSGDKKLSSKSIFAAISFIFVVITISTEIIPPATAAMAGACLVVISGNISLKEAFTAVSWSSMFIFAGMLALGDALQVSGADAVIADFLAESISDPVLLYVFLYTACLLITSFMSNSATAAVLLPIAITSAVRFGQSPYPYCMAVGIAASLDFLTPVGNGTCTIAYEMGGYKFMDFIKVGFPLQMVCALIGGLIIPVFFPF